MKKLLSAVLCLALALVMLVGCAETTIGDYYLENYEKPNKEIEEIKLNLYIIYEEGTESNARDTVEQSFSQLSLEKYSTAIDIFYYTASEYAEKMANVANIPDAEKPDILLVTSKALADTLIGADYLEDLTAFYASDAYGTLNVQLPTSLIEASKVVGADGKAKIYTVPNNHVLGQYEYLLVNKNEARYYYMGGESQLAAFTTYESTQELRDAMIADGKNPDDYVKVVNGAYEDKAKYEAEGYCCNVISVPQVSVEDAFVSAFAIRKGTKDANRAMQIIYAINTNASFRNTLQYGVAGTNYEVVDGNVERKSTGNSVYYMNIMYTGDMFTALSCSDLSWTDADKANGESQNRASVFVANP